jgi:hypothetical protein
MSIELSASIGHGQERDCRNQQRSGTLRKEYGISLMAIPNRTDHFPPKPK